MESNLLSTSVFPMYDSPIKTKTKRGVLLSYITAGNCSSHLINRCLSAIADSGLLVFNLKQFIKSSNAFSFPSNSTDSNHSTNGL
ncbi:MAG: hypothetical protein IPQ02_05230 [Saprospiraceae bacterium]|nr:hypothetical protein [Candidatus Defluviibacterium haderslevense]